MLDGRGWGNQRNWLEDTRKNACKKVDLIQELYHSRVMNVSGKVLCMSKKTSTAIFRCIPTEWYCVLESVNVLIYLIWLLQARSLALSLYIYILKIHTLFHKVVKWSYINQKLQFRGKDKLSDNLLVTQYRKKETFIIPKIMSIISHQQVSTQMKVLECFKKTRIIWNSGLNNNLPVYAFN